MFYENIFSSTAQTCNRDNFENLTTFEDIKFINAHDQDNQNKHKHKIDHNVTSY